MTAATRRFQCFLEMSPSNAPFAVHSAHFVVGSRLFHLFLSVLRFVMPPRNNAQLKVEIAHYSSRNTSRERVIMWLAAMSKSKKKKKEMA